MQKSLTIRLASLPEKHPSIAESLFGLADIARVVGFPQQAQDRYDEAVAMMHDKFRDVVVDTSAVWHKRVTDIMAGLAANAEEKGQLKSASEMWEKVVFHTHMLLKPCGAEQYSQVAYYQLRLAKLYVLLNKVSEAEGLIEKAGASLFSVIGEAHRPTKDAPLVTLGPLVALSYFTLGVLSNFKGNYCDAQDCYNKALRIWLSVLAYTLTANYKV